MMLAPLICAAAAAPPPATTQAAGDPAGVLASLADALEKGDRAAVESLYHPTGKSIIPERWLAVSRAIRELNGAAADRWGKQTPPLLPSAGHILRVIPQMGTLQTQGTQARFARVIDGKQEVLATFTRLDQKWTLTSLGTDPDDPPVTRAVDQYLGVLKTVTEKLRKGSYASASDASGDLENRLKQWDEAVQ
jgi:hypothetical protein